MSMPQGWQDVNEKVEATRRRRDNVPPDIPPNFPLDVVLSMTYLATNAVAVPKFSLESR
jgi:hypothetical protein